MRKYPTDAEYQQLCQEWQGAVGRRKDVLGNAIVAGMDDLIWRTVRQLLPSWNEAHLEDGHAAGLVGLVRGMQRFQAAKATVGNDSFINYMMYWIRNEILRFKHKEATRGVAMTFETRSKLLRALHAGDDVSLEAFTALGQYVNPDMMAGLWGYQTIAVDEAAGPVVHSAHFDYLKDQGLFDNDEDHNTERLELLHQHMQQLKPRQRDVVVRRLQGETLQGIASALGVSRQAIEVTEKKALTRLRKRIRNLSNARKSR